MSMHPNIRLDLGRAAVADIEQRARHADLVREARTGTLVATVAKARSRRFPLGSLAGRGRLSRSPARFAS